jgi:hypothetical protein
MSRIGETLADHHASPAQLALGEFTEQHASSIDYREVAMQLRRRRNATTRSQRK